jgi:hypothetical protein
MTGEALSGMPQEPTSASGAGIKAPISTKTFVAYFSWLLIVAGGSYTTYALIDGFATPFKNGEASLFICLLILVAVGEAVIGFWESREIRDGVWTAVAFSVAALGFAFNMYYVFAEKTGATHSVNLLQIFVLYCGAVYAWSARFAFDFGVEDILSFVPRYMAWLNSMGKQRRS